MDAIIFKPFTQSISWLCCVLLFIDASVSQTVQCNNGSVILAVCCNMNINQWGTMVSQLSLHIDNITGITPDGYEISDNGTLMHTSSANLTQLYSTKLKQQFANSIQVMPMIGASAGVTRLSTILNQNASSPVLAKFYNDITDLIISYDYDGFILDLEGPTNTNKTTQDDIIAFLNDFATVVHDVDDNDDDDHTKRSLGAFIHQCPIADFGIDCGSLGTSNMDFIITMDTYTADRSDWLKYFDDTMSSIHNVSKYSVGFEYNQNLSPYDYGYQNLNYMTVKTVNKLVVWQGLPPNSSQVTYDKYWSEFGSFVCQTI